MAALNQDELRELAGLMNRARIHLTTSSVMLRFKSVLDAARAAELLAQQGRDPQRPDPRSVSCKAAGRD